MCNEGLMIRQSLLSILSRVIKCSPRRTGLVAKSQIIRSKNTSTDLRYSVRKGREDRRKGHEDRGKNSPPLFHVLKIVDFFKQENYQWEKNEKILIVV